MADDLTVEYRVKIGGVVVYKGEDKALAHREASAYCNAFPEEGHTLLIEKREERRERCFCEHWRRCSGSHYRMGEWSSLGWWS
jgi:hypothetical protein